MYINIDLGKCTGCHLCVFSCPEKAISCFSVAIINRDKCTECLKCIGYCPVDAIERKEEEL